MRAAIVLTICALSAVLVAGRGSEKPSAAPVAAVDVAAAGDLVRSGGHRYLDVRTEEEFRNGHVKDSLNVPYVFFTSQGKSPKQLVFRSYIGNTSGKEKNPKFIEQIHVDLYLACSCADPHFFSWKGCKSGVRSELACIDLMAAGFDNVKNLEGGYVAWVENGCAVKKPQAQDEL
ncbi:hypothetical protein BAE44_0009229 [Dichanthelium oligosanthes]|uniref:Rhodanese domain-containing protein n=1 Tax=Dichanthelium oligosanthes TaxID=888268 RepID=A0A1E5VXC2_9POAL|nr:hypothetical protein BAE44_0009229 [Dichanthelium oligosanthes]